MMQHVLRIFSPKLMLVGFCWMMFVPKLEAQELRLLFAGDLMAHDVNLYQADYAEIYRYMKPYLDDHHLNFINIESVISDTIRPQGYPRFSAPSRYAQTAIEAGFNVFSLANNHSADHQQYGINQTRLSMQALKQKYPWIHYSGIKKAGEEEHFIFFYAGTIKVAFIAYTQFLNWQESVDVGAEEIHVADFRRAKERAEVIAKVKEVKDQADVVILSYHGGQEYIREVEEDKFAFFKELVDAGVDILWGHHPHVLQPVFRYKGAIIINSNGNFISGQTWAIRSSDAHKERAFTGDSLLYSISVYKDRQKKEIRLQEAIPISNYRHPERGMIVIDLQKIENYSFLSPAWQEFYRQRFLAISRYQLLLDGEDPQRLALTSLTGQ